MKLYIKKAVHLFLLSSFAALSLSISAAHADDRISLRHSRAELESMWRGRIQSFLDRGIIPMIDLQSSLRREDGEKYLKKALKVMDKEGLALISFDGYQAGKKKDSPKGYRWGYYIHEVVNIYPDRT
ncbi:MAG: hypothetical protein U9Q38_06330 [Thermodesulfobacteriota bacterium]|nr:hypothetical protein [Thermodesulfobacteriota bacterium]